MTCQRVIRGMANSIGCVYCNTLHIHIIIIRMCVRAYVRTHLCTYVHVRMFVRGRVRVSVSLTYYHFLDHCIGSLSDIALLLRYAQLSIKHFHPSNQQINIQCSLLQDSPDSFDHLILTYVLFPALRQILELEFFQLHQLTPC